MVGLRKMKILLAMTGASGIVYGRRLLEFLSEKEDIHVDLIVSRSGRELLKTESDISYDDLREEADRVFDPSDMKKAPSSGSSKYDAMAIVPCSMSSLSKIANGISDNLITRAAAVFLKEGRKVVVTPRETPLTGIWLENMKTLSEEGAVVLPAMPGYYGDVESVDDLVDFVVGKILDSLGLEHSLMERWEDIS